MDRGLYLLPNLLHKEADARQLFPPLVGEVVSCLDGLICESEKEGRLFLKGQIAHFRTLPLALLNEHTTDLTPLLSPLQRGERWGLISDGGLPLLADPGAELVSRLRSLKVPIHALPGPCSLICALQLSGFSAQRFTFHGYPPHKDEMLKERLRTLPKGESHLFIETPYRTEHFLKRLLHFLQEETRLSLSWNLTGPDQETRTERVREWKKKSLALGKVPAVFVIFR